LRLEKKGETVPQVPDEATLGRAAGGSGLGPSAREAELLELVRRPTHGAWRGRGSALGLPGEDGVGVGHALVAGLDRVLDVLAVLRLDQLHQLVRVLANDDRPDVDKNVFCITYKVMLLWIKAWIVWIGITLLVCFNSEKLYIPSHKKSMYVMFLKYFVRMYTNWPFVHFKALAHTYSKVGVSRLDVFNVE
jgi:hypothetical protein